MTDKENKEVRVLILAIHKADIEKGVAEKRSKALRTQLKTKMDAIHQEKIVLEGDKLQAYVYTPDEAIFDIARILTEVPLDQLLSTKTLTKLSTTGFDKLVRTVPAIADARTMVPKDEKTLVVEAYEPSKVK